MSDTAERPKKSLTQRLAGVARFLFGLAFLVFGLNGFFHFMPQPKDMPPGAADFFGAMLKTGYLVPLLFGTQTVVGALLVLNCFVPLALALIAPVIVNIVCFHLYVARPGLPLALIVAALELYLAWSYRKAFAPMLALKVRP